MLYQPVHDRFAVADPAAEWCASDAMPRRSFVGLELVITAIEAKRTPSQSRVAIDFDGVAGHLAAGSQREQAVAAEMRLESPRERDPVSPPDAPPARPGHPAARHPR